MLCAWAALLSSVNIWTLAVLWLLSCHSCHMEFHKLLFSCLIIRSLFLFLFLCCPWYTIFYTEPSGGYSFTIIGLKRTLVLERNSRGIMSSYTHMTRQWQFLCTYQ